MAERRMFAKTIIDSDAFLDMPLSTQALYFHLSMRADDEGFLNNPKKIMRMIGASEDDMKVLLSKRFVLSFDTGIIVIKHWRIHNYIRSDRLVETKYQEERQMLEVKENGAYTMATEIKEIEDADAKDKRKSAYKDSSLPYSFTYKIRRAFEGKPCPVCGRTMTSAIKSCVPTVQHNRPISKGGAHEIDNISVICESCNTSIQDTETGNLNNAEVVEIWDKIIYADKHKINWFDTPSILDEIDASQMSDNCQSNVSQESAQVRLGKDRLGEDRLGKVSIERFRKPTLEEVQAYCLERQNGLDAQRFIDYYESNGWKVGRNSMKDWKAAIRTWEGKEKKPKTQSFEEMMREL